VFAVLFALMVLGEKANSQAVLPAFVLGLVMSRHYHQHRLEQERLRVVAFAFLTPFFFLRGGMNVSLGAVFANLGCLSCRRREAPAKARAGAAAGAPLRASARPVHDASDEHRSDLRDDQLALWPAGPYHRPHPVLAAGDGRRALCDRSDRDRATVVQPRRRSRTRQRYPRRDRQTGCAPQPANRVPAPEGATQ
jgi:Sodium/hydrogen exchanger family